ncbi:hypothetical protein ACRS5S_17285 [Nocardia asiatica]|uniref:hypothetical protein n=1 Tax=Nocardia asiatica TaxID=209252 RepID=UPI0003185417|nr:hypothetical protein [Nocardia asiatica]
MAPGEGSSDAGEEISSGSSGGEAPDAPPPVRSSSDPSVENVWLRRRPPPARPGAPRMSTVILLVAFLAVLALYIVLHPSG